jgi:hypothetical protein
VVLVVMMSMSDPRQDRSSTAPLSVELSGNFQTGSLRIDWASRIPKNWLGLTGYLVAGVCLGLVLILALSLSRTGDPAPTANAGIVTDNVMRLHAREIADGCWTDAPKDGPARVTVSMEVGVDGKVRSAVAAGESRSMRSCIESHVKSWEFLPQAQAQAMVLPFEIDRR